MSFLRHIVFRLLRLSIILPSIPFSLFAQSKTDISVEIYQPKALDVISSKISLEALATGFKWAEGPVWVAELNALLFSDIPNNRVMKYEPERKRLSVFAIASGYTGTYSDGYKGGSNGLAISPEHDLILFQHGDRRVAKKSLSETDANTGYLTLVDNYQGKRLNSPNDGVFANNGDLYFTDPPYGLMNKLNDRLKMLAFQGIYLLKQSGELILLEDSIKFPNGIALSNDEKTLVVSVSDPEAPHWVAYDTTADGLLKNKRVLFKLSQSSDKSVGLPDGMAMHSSGILFSTGPGGLWLFSLLGEALAFIPLSEKVTNCTFNQDESTLFITSPTKLLSFSLKHPSK